MIIIFSLLTIFDFIAASSESVCNILPVNGGVYGAKITLKEWFLIDAYTWIIGVALVVMGAYFPNNSKRLMIPIFLGSLLVFQKIFWVLIGTAIGWGGEYFSEIGCAWSAMVVYIRVYTTPLTILIFCICAAGGGKK